jgi:phage gp36-like protein
MAYSTQADIEKRIPKQDLEDLTDDKDLKTPDAVIIAEAIADADVLIDAYLRGRYAVPMSPVPGFVKRLSIDLAVFYVYERRFNLSTPEGASDRYKRAVEFLEAIAEGTAKLPASTVEAPAEESVATPIVSNASKRTRVFSQKTLEGY